MRIYFYYIDEKKDMMCDSTHCERDEKFNKSHFKKK